MEYVCNNPECPECGKKEYFSSETYKYRSGRLVGEHSQCPKCGVEREEINPNKNVPLSEKNIGIGLFAGMSKEQKQEVLKKRSHEHFKRNVEERKEGLMSRAINEMRNMNKR